jgi:methylglutaconyl-CoA hydratase
MSAEEARHYGLVHDVVGEQELDATIESFVVMILKGGPQAIADSKELFRFVSSRSIDASLHEENARRIAFVRASKEGVEGIDAFLNKRSPSWIP